MTFRALFWMSFTQDLISDGGVIEAAGWILAFILSVVVVCFSCLLSSVIIKWVAFGKAQPGAVVTEDIKHKVCLQVGKSYCVVQLSKRTSSSTPDKSISMHWPSSLASLLALTARLVWCCLCASWLDKWVWNVSSLMRSLYFCCHEKHSLHDSFALLPTAIWLAQIN